MHIYLDCDGILANFDKMACEALGVGYRSPEYYNFEKKYSPKLFWQRIEVYTAGDVFGELEVLGDAKERVKQLQVNNHIKVLTKLSAAKQAELQKRFWIKDYFGISGPDDVICVPPGHAKGEYAKPGDILIDDHEKNNVSWVAAGGVFIYFQDNWDEVFTKLRELGIKV